MTNDRLLAFMATGPVPSVRREQGMRDARAGKPALSRDPDYRRGYELGQRLGSRNDDERQEEQPALRAGR